MASELRLTLRADSDGTGELFVQASANGFSGRASAWFDLVGIAAFGHALEAYPIPEGAPPRLESGFWSKDGGGLEQRHVGLLVVPVNRRGTLAIQVHLETPAWPGERPGSQHRMDLEVLTDYASLQEFAKAVQRLATGAGDEAVLASVVTAS